MARVYFVGAGPGDPGLITVRGRDLLSRADVLVYTGSLVNPRLVEDCPAHLKVDSHGMRLEDIGQLLVRHARAGSTVVRLHSGDPSLYGAIVEQMQLLSEAGVDFEVIPGVSSLFAAAAALKTQLTLGGVAESLIVTRPAGSTLEHDEIAELSEHRATMVFFLGTAHLEEITSRVRCPPETPAAVVYHASWDDQRIVRGTVADIAEKAREAGIERTALLIIGGVLEPASSGHRRSHLYS
ncbi:MAG TPA: precorrin-4 C(11)-methyltransferase [Methanolinea sp.]|nr:precorrin-4 C(11)-methyltransferase [Methanolinea sp.]HRU79237.1 precorrin-4 C(11)-methyltransferase [Methanolinea sp.]